MKSELPLIISVAVSVLLIFSLATEDKRHLKRVIGATAICADGSITTAKRAPGVCSSHGGVKEWLE